MNDNDDDGGVACNWCSGGKWDFFIVSFLTDNDNAFSIN